MARKGTLAWVIKARRLPHGRRWPRDRTTFRRNRKVAARAGALEDRAAGRRIGRAAGGSRDFGDRFSPVHGACSLVAHGFSRG